MTKYFGKICDVHPDNKGERFTYNNLCTECERKRQAEYRKSNREAINNRQKEYYHVNKDKVKARTKAYTKTKIDTDSVFDLKCRLRNKIGKTLRRLNCAKTKRLLVIGCSDKQLFDHIQSQFADGMNWENRHLWHIDHIIPMATAKTVNDVIRLNHYTNLRPLWAFDNLSKGSKIK